jgi:hypothetical protein
MIATESRPQKRRHDPEMRQVSGRDNELPIDKPDVGMVVNEIEIVMSEFIQPPSMLPQHRFCGLFHA